MSYEEEKKCSSCAEEMYWTDQLLNPCKCGFEVCVWCWYHIMDMAEKESTEGRCPACRTPYDKDRVVGLETNFHRVASISSSRKQMVTKAKPKQNEGRKDLSNVRVIQRKMVYISGLPVDYAHEELLERKEYFGQYGEVTKVSLSRTAGGTLNDTCSVYVTFSKEEEAVRCIQSVHGYDLAGRILRASFGTAKYCHAWLRNTVCNNPGCLNLHTMGADEDCFVIDKVAAGHTRNRVKEKVGATKYPPRRCGYMSPPPIVEQSNSYSDSADDPVHYDGRKSVASSDHLLCSKDKDATVRPSKETTTFVDIVGRSSNSVEEERWLNLSHDNHVDTKSLGSVLSKNSEISDDQKSKDSAELSRTSSLSSAESKDPAASSHTTSFISAESKDPADTTKDYNYNSRWHTGYHNQSSNADNEGLNFSAVQDSFENKDHRYKSQHQASRAQNLTPPGFSILSKPSPGFSGCMRTHQAVSPASRAQNSTPPGFSKPAPPGFSKPAPGFSGCMRIDQAVAPASGSAQYRFSLRRTELEAKVNMLRDVLIIDTHKQLIWKSFHHEIIMRIELLKEGIQAGEMRLPELLVSQQQAALDGLIRLLHFTQLEMLLLEVQGKGHHASYLKEKQKLAGITRVGMTA